MAIYLGKPRNNEMTESCFEALMGLREEVEAQPSFACASYSLTKLILCTSRLDCMWTVNKPRRRVPISAVYMFENCGSFDSRA